MTKLKKLFFVLLLLHSQAQIFAQSLKGTVSNRDSELLIGVNLLIVETGKRYFTTKSDPGYFEFQQLPSGKITLHLEKDNYESRTLIIDTRVSDYITIQLEEKHSVFEEVVITSVEGKLQRENVNPVSYRSRSNLFETGATTLGEALMNIPGVQQNTIGIGISRPVIRGLTGMRVVTYWDGLRIENQQWGEDHGMATSELGLKGVEVVKGPSTLIYGADALGGVIHYRDEEYLQSGQNAVQFASRYETNTQGVRNELGFKTAGEQWRLNAFVNYMGHTDYQLADGNFVGNSRFWTSNGKVALGYKNRGYLLNARYHGAISRIGIPGHTHDLDPDFSQFIRDRRGLRSPVLPAQHIFNNFLNVEQKWITGASHFNLHTGYTYNHLREFDHDRFTPFTNLVLQNATYNASWQYFISEKVNIKTGSQGMFQWNRNLKPTESYLIPDANTIDNGIYSLLSFEKDKWRVLGGSRLDTRIIRSFAPGEDIDSSIIQNIDADPILRNYLTWNNSLGAVRNDKHSTLRANFSSGFRAPHLAELLANGVHHGSLRFERGDRALVEEQAFQFDLALELHFDHFEFIINPYVSMINNFIYLRNTDSIVASPAGNFKYFEFTQVDRAFLYGGEVGFHYHPHSLHRLHLESTFSLTIGQDQNGNPLNLMPQPDLNSRVRFDINNNNRLSIKHLTLEHQFFARQNRVTPFEAPTDAFHLVHFAIHGKWNNLGKSNLNWALGARNLMNTNFIAHLSPLKNLGDGIPQAGRNFFIEISYDLDWKKKATQGKS